MSMDTKSSVHIRRASSSTRNIGKKQFMGDEESEPSLAGGEEVKQPSKLSKTLEFLFHPLTLRYTCRPIVRPWPAVWILVGLAILCTTVSILMRASYSYNQVCIIEYPSALYDEAGDLYDAVVALDKVDYPWVTFGVPQCDETDCYRLDTIVIGPDRCSNMESFNPRLFGNIHFFYNIEPFYQNHRQYVFSRDSTQLEGNWRTVDEASMCEPLVTVQDYVDTLGDLPPAWPDLDDVSEDLTQVVLHPCGLQAVSVFNDTFEVFQYDPVTEGPGEQIEMATDSDTISARATNFNQADPSTKPTDESGKYLVYEWLEPLFEGGITNPHFINWMRLSPIPSIMKLFGTFTADTITLPLVIKAKNRYTVRPWQGKKSIVITTLPYMGYVETICFTSTLVLAIAITLIVLVFASKLRLRPRLVGDIRLLYSRNTFA